MAIARRDGVAIHYESVGSGPALLLQTGAGGDSSMWRQAGYLRELRGRRAVLIDHRGHGMSDRPAGVGRHRIDAYVDDVLAVADALELERFAFAGYSDGAAVGYRLGATRPERVQALIGIGAVGPPGGRWSQRTASAARVREEGMAALAERLRQAEPGLPGWFADQMLSTDPEMFALELESWTAWGGPWTDFAAIRAPVLIVAGELEEGPGGAAASHARLAAQAMPDGRCAVVPGLGHCLTFARADLVAPQMAAFLDAVVPGAAA